MIYVIIALLAIFWLSVALGAVLTERVSNNYPKYKIGFIDFTFRQYLAIWLIWPIWLIPLMLYGVLSGNVWRSIKEERSLEKAWKNAPPETIHPAYRHIVDEDVASLYPSTQIHGDRP